ncbi:catechol 2,3-dioxygenase-like lactoylglutathione lyase family enzyme [Rhizobium aquaticum]|uniref:Catechol 2,3-dioxygenase-like lactoylglutathione lyase family enzyme n=1 Tax=Rhizobium aquaticum TaxID=1549636 RepID=A0ABV2J1C1_9HYPH
MAGAQRIEGILETALYAADLHAAADFYGRVLGLQEITHVEGRHIFFRCGQGVLLIFNPDATELPPHNLDMPVPQHGARGVGHVCFRVAGEEMDAMRARLEAEGVPIEADFRWPNGARSLYFRDPAGNSLECAEAKLWNL